MIRLLPSPHRRRRHRRNVIVGVVFLLAVITVIAGYLVNAHLILFLNHISITSTSDPTFFVYVAALQNITRLLFTLLLTELCARRGPSFTLTITLCLVATGILIIICASSTSNWLFLLGYMMFAPVLSMRQFRTSILADVVQPSERTSAFSLHAAMIPVGSLLGPITWIALQTSRQILQPYLPFVVDPYSIAHLTTLVLTLLSIVVVVYFVKGYDNDGECEHDGGNISNNTQGEIIVDAEERQLIRVQKDQQQDQQHPDNVTVIATTTDGGTTLLLPQQQRQLQKMASGEGHAYVHDKSSDRRQTENPTSVHDRDRDDPRDGNSGDVEALSACLSLETPTTSYSSINGGGVTSTTTAENPTTTATTCATTTTYTNIYSSSSSSSPSSSSCFPSPPLSVDSDSDDPDPDDRQATPSYNDNSQQELHQEATHFPSALFLLMRVLCSISTCIPSISFQPLIVDVFNASDTTLAHLYILSSSFAILLTTLLAKLSSRLRDGHMLLLGFLLMLTGQLLYLPLFGSKVRLWQVVMGYVLSFRATVYTPTMTSAFTKGVATTKERDRVLGVSGAVVNGGMAMTRMVAAERLLPWFGTWRYAVFTVPLVLSYGVYVVWMMMTTEGEERVRVMGRGKQKQRSRA